MDADIIPYCVTIGGGIGFGFLINSRWPLVSGREIWFMIMTVWLMLVFPSELIAASKGTLRTDVGFIFSRWFIFATTVMLTVHVLSRYLQNKLLDKIKIETTRLSE